MIRRPGKSHISSFVKEYYLGNWNGLILGVTIVSAFIFCYAKVFATIAGQWWTNDMYSYGFLIPWISLYLVWIRREKLSRISRVPNYIGGLVFFLTGILMLLLGQAGGVITLQELSLIITILGLILLLLGTRFFQALWLPLVYLFFMIPIWDFFTDRLHFPFQIFSATLGVNILQFIGIPAFRQDNYIALPNITLEVARVCSGVNYLIAVVAIGIPLAYLFLRRWKRRVLFLCSAVFIAGLFNGVRVALIGILSYYGLSGNIHGPFHILQGLSVSMVGYGALFGVLWILNRKPPVSSMLNEKQCIHQPVQPMSQKKIPYFVLSVKSSASFCTLVLLLGGSYLNFYHNAPVPLKRDLRNFSSKIGEWQGRDVAPDYKEFRVLGVDQDLSRTYQKASGETIWFYMGYFDYQDQQKKLVSYKTQDLNLETTKIKVKLNPHNIIELNKKVILNDRNRGQLMLFCYDLNGRIVTNNYMARVYTAWDALTRGRTNGAIIMLISNFSNTEDLEKILYNDGIFIQKIIPMLKDYLPEG